MKLSRPLNLLSDDVHAMHSICARIARRRAEERAVLPAPEEWPTPARSWLRELAEAFLQDLTGIRTRH